MVLFSGMKLQIVSCVSVETNLFSCLPQADQRALKHQFMRRRFTGGIPSLWFLVRFRCAPIRGQIDSCQQSNLNTAGPRAFLTIFCVHDNDNFMFHRDVLNFEFPAVPGRFVA